MPHKSQKFHVIRSKEVQGGNDDDTNQLTTEVVLYMQLYILILELESTAKHRLIIEKSSKLYHSAFQELGLTHQEFS